MQEALGHMQISVGFPSIAITAVGRSRAEFRHTLRDDAAHWWSIDWSLEVPRQTLWGFLTVPYKHFAGNNLVHNADQRSTSCRVKGRHDHAFLFINVNGVGLSLTDVSGFFQMYSVYYQVDRSGIHELI